MILIELKQSVTTDRAYSEYVAQVMAEADGLHNSRLF